jgi:hypothetical protein
MRTAATDRRLAWLVLAILACVALIGFGRGLSQALSARAPQPGESSALLASPSSVQPRDASSPAPLDEARVHEIAREEADAALTRARPAPRKPRAEPEADDDDADTGGDDVRPLPAPPAITSAAPQTTEAPGSSPGAS